MARRSSENPVENSFNLPFSSLLELLQNARELRPPKHCHAEIQTRLPDGQARIVCVGECPKGDCKRIEKEFGKTRKLVTCGCSLEDFGGGCNLVIVTKDGQIETSFCVGDCPTGKKCRRGVVLDGNVVRIFCACG